MENPKPDMFRIAVLIDLETVPDIDPDFEGKSDEIRESMEFHVIVSLRELGYDTHIVPFGPDPADTLHTLQSLQPDLVFNLTEHFHGDRHLDVSIAGMLDLLKLPYTGSGATGLMLCRDKVTCKRILGYHRIRLPHFFSVPVGRSTIREKVVYPAIIKPALEDGSDGISISSIVRDRQELMDRVKQIHDRMKQPAICEEFIEGRELYVGMIGNDRITSFPAREIRFGRIDQGGPPIATARVKWDERYREKWKIEYGHAGLEPELEAKVAKISKRIYRILQIRDYGRIDLRLTDKGDIVFLEANPNPNLCAGEDLSEAAERAGIDHTELVDRIVRIARKRYGI